MDLTDSDLDDLLRSVDLFPESAAAATPEVVAALDELMVPLTAWSGGTARSDRRGPRSRRVVAGLAAGSILAVGGVAAAATINPFARSDGPDFAAVARSAAAGIPLPPGDDIDNYITTAAQGVSGDFDRSTLRVYFSYDAVCAWQGYWLQAHDAGHAEAAQESLDVLEAVPDWPQWASNVDVSVPAGYRAEATQAAGGNAAPIRQAWTANCTELPRAWASK